MPFKNIMVAIDGSKNSFRGLEVAINIARQCQSTITGYYVVPVSKPKVDAPISSLEKIFLDYAAKFMRKAKTLAAKKGILFIDRISYGEEGSKIIEFSKRNNFDIIVIGSRGRGSAKEIFLGSTSNYVLHKSKKPVLIVK